MPNEFRRPQFHDHEIIDGDGNKVGDIRVKPSGVLWAPKGSQKWYRVTLEQFAVWIEQNGTKQDK